MSKQQLPLGTENQGSIEVQGTVHRITFRSEDTGYTIAKLTVSGQPSTLTITGALVDISPGEALSLRGQMTEHPKYGLQMKVEKFERLAPTSNEEIIKYLGSGLIKGLGPVMAERVVAAFGKDTIDVMDNHIKRLTKVEGIGAKRIKQIKESWDDQKELRSSMLYLNTLGIGNALATKIYKHFGKNTLDTVKKSPYTLATEVAGIGFATADRIAGEAGIPEDSPERAKAGVIYAMREASSEGHVFLPYGELIENAMGFLGIHRDIIGKAIAQLTSNRTLIMEDISDDTQDDLQNQKAVYLRADYMAELAIAASLKELIAGQSTIQDINIASELKWVEEETKLKLADSQKEALTLALKSKVLLITGGPGTGKTTVLNSIIKIFMRNEKTIELSAPTGRAAKRLSMTTGQSARTIHRLLEFNPAMSNFTRDMQNPLEADLVVIDEMSMVDSTLMYNLLKAVPKDASLILVGDADQLPSVGAGNVLHDLLASESIATVRLTEVFRQAAQSLIIRNAHMINSGESPDLSASSKEEADFFFFKVDGAQEAADKIVEICSRRIPDKFGMDPMSSIQVLTPMHKGELGTANLNLMLQESLNQGGAELKRGSRIFRTGDKIMQTSNNYDKDVYNGDIGIILRADSQAHTLLVDFDGKEVAYDMQSIDELTHAYAITIHKSQGSEYPAVVIPLHTQHFVMLQRNLLYTAITRAKQLVVLVGTEKAIAMAVKNHKPRMRHTLLEARIREKLK